MAEVSHGGSLTVLGLTVAYGGVTQDIVAEMPFGASVTAFELALTAHLSPPPTAFAIRVHRTGEQLKSTAILTDCDLRSGDAITLVPAPSHRDPTEVILNRVPRTESEVRLRRGKGAPQLPAAALVRLDSSAGQLEVPAGTHVVGSGLMCDLQHPSLPDLAFEIRCAPDASFVRTIPGGPLVSVDGSVINGDWQTLPDGARLRVGPTTLTAHRGVDADEPDGRGDRLVIGSLGPGRVRIDLGAAGEVPFNRPPRASSAWRPARLELPEPPQPPRRVRVPFAAAIIPLVLGGVLALVLQSVFLLCFMLLTPLMMAGTYISDRRSGRKDHEEAVSRFERRLETAEAQIAEATDAEGAERRRAAPRIDALVLRALQQDERLWERRPWDGDFLSLRLGAGRLPSQTEVVVPKVFGRESDPRLEELAGSHRDIPDVPYLLELAELGAVGLAGDRAVNGDVVRSLVIQAAALHSPAELGIAAALPAGSEAGWEWLKWLPHSTTAAAMIEGAALGTGRVAGDVLQSVRDHQRRRLDERDARFGRGATYEGPALLVVIDEEVRPERSLVADLLAAARDTRTVFIWIGRDPRGLPGPCRVTVDAQSSRYATTMEIDSGISNPAIALEGLGANSAADVARALAPMRDAGSANASGAIPARLRLIDQLDLHAPSGEQLAERWQRRTGSLGATLGQGAEGPFRIDLRSDGPHCLIAGTTGAGKSELLRTLVASLAADHPPSRLAFLLVDYKGGAAFTPCAALPHVLDVVSDLDAELGERALVSLDAEMKYRERLLAETRADNQIDLERRFPDVAPPNLVIMVDEFAKLREEIPEFVDGVVDIAQRGRALGIHMVLAAQSLRTAFTPAVRANTNLRIALRVTSDDESQDVLDAPDASRIPSGDLARGRAFARIGQERLAEFQTAHVSGRYLAPSEAEVLVRPFGMSGILAPALRRGAAAESSPAMDETDLAALARAANAANALLGLPAPRRAWTHPLPERLSRTVLQAGTNVGEGRCAIGLVDEPADQRQRPLLLEFDRGHVGIFGIGGAGKTSALQTIAAALATSASPAEVQIYGLDAGGGGLSVIGALPHVGAVVPAADAERVERLLDRLEREMRARSGEFASSGSGSLTEFAKTRSTHQAVPPRLVLLLDDFGEFANVYDDARAGSPFERVLGLLAGGRSVGIHVVVTADRRSAVRSNAMAHIAQRLILRMASREDLLSFGIPSRAAESIYLIDGRGFTQDGRLFQVAMADAAVGAGPAAGFALLGDHLSEVWSEEHTPSVEALPETVPLRRIAVRRASPSALPIGVGGPELDALTVDLSERHFVVAGPYDSGRSNVLAVLAEQAADAVGVHELHLLAPRTSPLVDRGLWTSVARGPQACGEAIMTLAARAEDLPEVARAQILLMIDDAGELQDAATWGALERIVRLGRDRGIRVVASAETSAARMMSNFWLAEARRDGQGLLLAPDLQTDGGILGAALPRRTSVAMVPGRGFLVTRGAATLVQVAQT